MILRFIGEDYARRYATYNLKLTTYNLNINDGRSSGIGSEGNHHHKQ